MSSQICLASSKSKPCLVLLDWLFPGSYSNSTLARYRVCLHKGSRDRRKQDQAVQFSGSATSRLSPSASVTLCVLKPKEQLFAPRLAQKLGDAAHVPGHAIRPARTNGAGERLAERLLNAAVARGAKHDQREFDILQILDRHLIQPAGIRELSHVAQPGVLEMARAPETAR
jgi:hypothetical protein